MESELGEVREIRIGAFKRAAFWSISELIRPVVINIRISGQVLSIRHKPAILSSVLCLPISSAAKTIFSPSLNADVWTPPVSRYSSCDSNSDSTRRPIASGATLGWSPVKETSTRANASTAVTPPVQPEVRRQDWGWSTLRFSQTSTLSPCSQTRTSSTSSIDSIIPSLYRNPTDIASRLTGVHMNVSHTSPLTVSETGLSTIVSASYGFHFLNSYRS